MADNTKKTRTRRPFWERQMPGARIRRALEGMGIDETGLEQFQKEYQAARANRWVTNEQLRENLSEKDAEIERLREEMAKLQGE